MFATEGIKLPGSTSLNRSSIFSHPLRYTPWLIAVSITILIVRELDISNWGITMPQLPSFTASLPSPTSAWFAPGGYLRLDLQHGGFRTRYEIPMDTVDRQQYICDEERFSEEDIEESNDRLAMCINYIVFSTAFFDNMDAQRAAQQSGDLDEEEIDRKLAKSYAQLQDIRGKRILVIGDSMDRYWLDHLARDYSDVGIYRSMEFGGQVYESWDQRPFIARTAIVPLLPSIAAVKAYKEEQHTYIDTYNETTLHPDTIRFDTIFAPGQLESHEIDFNLVGSTPSSTTGRIELSAKQWGGDAHDGTPYTMATVNFGVWDLFRHNYHNFLTHGRDNYVGLELEWLMEYLEKASGYIALMRSLWGHGVEIFIRSTADVNYLHDTSIQPEGLPAGTPRDQAYSLLRMQQLRAAQDVLMRRENLRSIPFAQLVLGQPVTFLRDNLHPSNQANMMYMELLFRRLEKLPARSREL